jgi:hypothetical protein
MPWLQQHRQHTLVNRQLHGLSLLATVLSLLQEPLRRLFFRVRVFNNLCL